jgi:iron-sulfur cluster assembly accessory protein
MNAITPSTAVASDAVVAITENAFRRVAKVTAGESAPSALRVSVEGGGCSGFSYKFDIVPAAPNSDDLVFQRDGGTLLIDELSVVYMKGSVIDFIDDLMGQAFKITNPNAVASCGCGTSFSV